MGRRLPANTWAKNGADEEREPSRWSLPERPEWTYRSGGPRQRRRDARAEAGGGRPMPTLSMPTLSVPGFVSRVRWRLMGIGAVVLLVIAAVVAAIALAVGGGSDQAAAPVATSTESSAVPGAVDCPVIESEGRLQGNSAGGQDSAKELIMAYEHAFFTGDAAAMVAMTKPGPYVASKEALQAGIDDLPPELTWCVTIVPSGTSGVFDVTVRHAAATPDSPVVVWRQDMTVQGSGPFKITAVKAR